MSNPSSACFHKLVFKEVPESTGEMIAHNVAAIAELTERIKALDTSISRLVAERYPETIYLQPVSGPDEHKKRIDVANPCRAI